MPVYYIGLGGRLYREYHHVAAASTSTTDQVAAAVSQLFGPTAVDPSYHSGWPAGITVRSVRISGGIATIDLHGDGIFRAEGATPDPSEKAMLQQLIWTGTAFTGGTGIQLLVDGKPVTSIAGQRGVLRRGPAVDVLASIWIIDPQQGAITGPNVTVNVAGIVFEAQFTLRIRNASGVVVKNVSVHLSAGSPAQGTATVHVTLPPGTYTIEAVLLSLKDTSEQVIDDHTFTVTS